MSSTKTSTTTVLSDSAFNKQADATREALKTFAAISLLKAPGPAKLAMAELVDAAVSSYFCFL